VEVRLAVALNGPAEARQSREKALKLAKMVEPEFQSGRVPALEAQIAAELATVKNS